MPDVNLLVYAYNAESPFHQRAAAWWTHCLNGREAVGLAHPVLFGFIRIITNARIFEQPMTLAEARNHVEQWLARSVTQVLLEARDHAQRVIALLHAAGSSGANLVTDAQIAALCLAYGGQVHTSDRDFMRFPNLKCRFVLETA